MSEQQPEQIVLSIPAVSIANLSTFEASRLKAYQEGERSGLTDLAEQTTLRDGASLFDEFGDVIDAIDDPISKARQESERKARELSAAITGTVLYDLVLGPDAEIHDIFRREIVPEDVQRTKAAQRMVRAIPSGPKQNRSSFMHRPDQSSHR